MENCLRFHIVEGDRDYLGATKPYEFEELLRSGKFDPWKSKITYHKARIPATVKGHALQDAQRLGSGWKLWRQTSIIQNVPGFGAF